MQKNKNANPIEFAIEFAWANGCDLFTINNAKDELKRLKAELEFLKESLDKPVAYAKVTDDGILYDLHRQNNPYSDQTKVIPLYTPYKIKHE